MEGVEIILCINIKIMGNSRLLEFGIERREGGKFSPLLFVCIEHWYRVGFRSPSPTFKNSNYTMHLCINQRGTGRIRICLYFVLLQNKSRQPPSE